MSFRKLCIATLTCIFIGCTTIAANTEKIKIAKAEMTIKKHSEPKYRNTFIAFTPAEIKCMAMNIYHEARNESLAGKVAVILVTMNRVADKRFPNTICGVVHEGKHRYVNARMHISLIGICVNLVGIAMAKMTGQRILEHMFIRLL